MPQTNQPTNSMKTIILKALVLSCVLGLLAPGLRAQVANTNTVTLFDDGGEIIEGIYALAFGARPEQAATPEGLTYSGHDTLIITGDRSQDTARDPANVAAFVRNDVPLNHGQDWFIRMEVANDFVSPGYMFRLWLLPGQQPDSTLLNSGDIRDRMTFSFGVGDQLPGDNVQGGFFIEANKGSGLDTNVLAVAGARLDPVPDQTLLGGGRNTLVVQWLAASKTYVWRISNRNGTREVTVLAAGLALQPQTTWFAAGTTDNTIWQASGWTIYDITYGQGVLPTPSPIPTVTLFDDGNPIYDNQGNPSTNTVSGADSGVYDLGGAGRPAEAATATGKTYSGHEYLTVWGDPMKDTARGTSRIAAFVRNDVGLDHSQDWFIRLDVANDFVSPDYGFRLWLLPGTQPDATLLNSGNIRNRMTFAFGVGDQLAGNNDRNGFGIEANRTDGLADILPGAGPRLDPLPDQTLLRGGHNMVEVQWLAGSQTYTWRVTNTNGTREVTVAASALALQPQTTWFAAGTTDNGIWQGTGWTIHDITYGQGVIPRTATVTLFDDGGQIYNNGVYDLGGAGRPAEAAAPAGKTYSGHEYLTIWGDPVRSAARSTDRIAAFVRNDVGLDQSKDWFIRMDVANDFVSPDYNFRLWLLPGAQPDANLLNSGNIRNRMTFAFKVGDQAPNNNFRDGFGLEVSKVSGVDVDAIYAAGPRLDPDPDETLLRGGHNLVEVQWLAGPQTYTWKISNVNGMLEMTVPAADLMLKPQTTWFAAGTTDNTIWQATGWTIFDITYGQGLLPGPRLEFAASGDQLTLSWAAAGFVLQQNDDLANAAGWADVPNGETSPVTVTISGGSLFFRLIKP